MNGDPAIYARVRGSDGSTVFVQSVNDITGLGRATCALLNSSGGTVLCGVAADGRVIGIKRAAEGVAQRLGRELGSAISPNALFMVHVSKLDGQDVVAIEVPQGRDAPYVFEGGVWLREGVETIPADVDSLRRLLRVQAEIPLRWERRQSTAMSPDDLDRSEVLTTARESDGRLGTRLRESGNEMEILNALSLYEPAKGFTNASDVLFSQLPSRRHPQIRAHLVVYAGDKSSDVFVDNRWFDGPLVRICREMIAAVGALNTVKSVFRPGRDQREDLTAYDAIAIREAIVNAFVHRDYSAYSGGLRVSVYHSRIEVWNSGHLPEGITPGRLREEHDSVVVNPDIAGIFNLHGLIERVGRGTQYIVEASRRLGATPPVWSDTATGVTLRIHSSHAAPDAGELNARQVWLLSKFVLEREFSANELYGMASDEGFKIVPRTLRRDLEDLVTRRLLVLEARGNLSRYRLRE